jgi:hypothetical protein
VSQPNLIKHEQFPSRSLRNKRDLIVYLPPGYDAQPGRRFPVIFLHDGQNLFDGSTSFIPGMDWHVGQTADHGIYEGRIFSTKCSPSCAKPTACWTARKTPALADHLSAGSFHYI